MVEISVWLYFHDSVMLNRHEKTPNLKLIKINQVILHMKVNQEGPLLKAVTRAIISQNYQKAHAFV